MITPQAGKHAAWGPRPDAPYDSPNKEAAFA